MEKEEFRTNFKSILAQHEKDILKDCDALLEIEPSIYDNAKTPYGEANCLLTVLMARKAEIETPNKFSFPSWSTKFNKIKKLCYSLFGKSDFLNKRF